MEWADKPSSVLDGHLSGQLITQLLALRQQPTRASNAPGRRSALFGLAGGGVYPAGAVAGAAVRSYRTFSPLPVPRRRQ